MDCECRKAFKFRFLLGFDHPIKAGKSTKVNPATIQRSMTQRMAFGGQKEASSRGCVLAERRKTGAEGGKCGFPPKAATMDNSPAIYGWDYLSANIRVPAGTEESGLSSLPGLGNVWRTHIPSAKVLGNYRRDWPRVAAFGRKPDAFSGIGSCGNLPTRRYGLAGTGQTMSTCFGTANIPCSKEPNGEKSGAGGLPPSSTQSNPTE